MSRESSLFYRRRFQEYRADLVTSWAVRENTIAPVETILRSIHRRYLGFACLTTVLAQNALRNDYVKALPEVSYLSTVLAVKGLDNPSSVLLRQSIELALKHIYFTTHPTEFGWSLNRTSYREISFQFLIEYIRKTDESSAFPHMTELIGEVDRQFHVLSRFVHMHSRRFIPYRTSASVTAAHRESIGALNQKTRELWPVLTVLLIAFFPKRFLRANANEKAIILMSAGVTRATHVKSYLRSLAAE